MRPVQFEWIDSMALNDKVFFVELGKRVAHLR